MNRKNTDRHRPFSLLREVPAALGVEDAEDDQGDGKHQGGDDEAERQVQLVPVNVEVCEGEAGVGPAVVAGDGGVVDPVGGEPGGG